jgi:hypothetical protein
VSVGRAAFSVVTGVAVAATLALAGCGETSTTPPPGGPLAEALASVGGGGAHGSLGIGWADPQLDRQAGLRAGLIGEALGPNARSVIEQAPRLGRRFGVHPLTAERLVSVGGSYAFGLRLDGVDGSRLAQRLVAAGGRTRRIGPLELVDIGDYAVVPGPLLRSGVLGLGAFDAFGRGLTVLAISETARDALLGRGDRLLDEPTYRAAADCLGRVVAARLIPDKLLLSTELGVDLVALGVQTGEREVLCVLGGTAQRADQVASALKGSLAPDAREPVTGRPMSESVAEAEIARDRYEGVEVVRAKITLAAGQAPGFLFDTVSRGSLVRLINGS